MLETIILILLVLWFTGLLVGGVGVSIHTLLFVAIVLVLIRLVR